LTGGGRTSRPRPAGRSGWHTTRGISAIAWSASREGTEICGVPKKMARTRGGCSATRWDRHANEARLVGRDGRLVGRDGGLSDGTDGWSGAPMPFHHAKTGSFSMASSPPRETGRHARRTTASKSQSFGLVWRSCDHPLSSGKLRVRPASFRVRSTSFRVDERDHLRRHGILPQKPLRSSPDPREVRVGCRRRGAW